MLYMYNLTTQHLFVENEAACMLMEVTTFHYFPTPLRTRGSDREVQKRGANFGIKDEGKGSVKATQEIRTTHGSNMTTPMLAAKAIRIGMTTRGWFTIQSLNHPVLALRAYDIFSLARGKPVSSFWKTNPCKQFFAMIAFLVVAKSTKAYFGNSLDSMGWLLISRSLP